MTSPSSSLTYCDRHYKIINEPDDDEEMNILILFRNNGFITFLFISFNDMWFKNGC